MPLRSRLVIVGVKSPHRASLHRPLGNKGVIKPSLSCVWVIKHKQCSESGCCCTHNPTQDGAGLQCSFKAVRAAKGCLLADAWLVSASACPTGAFSRPHRSCHIVDCSAHRPNGCRRRSHGIRRVERGVEGAQRPESATGKAAVSTDLCPQQYSAS